MTQQEEYKHIAEWLAYQRKENARIFEEMLQEKGVNNIGCRRYILRTFAKNMLFFCRKCLRVRIIICKFAAKKQNYVYMATRGLASVQVE